MTPGRNAVGRRARALPQVIWLLVLGAAVAGCGSPPPAPMFAIAVQNGSDLGVRLNVVVVADEKPSHSLKIPSGSGILETAEAPMSLTGTQAVRVVVEIYTDTCDLLESVTVGSGTTLISIKADSEAPLSAAACTTSAEPWN